MENKAKLFGYDLKLILLFIPVAYFSYLFHECGHWITGELLGNKMAYSLNYVYPESGQYIKAEHDVYVSIGGPAFSILQGLIAYLVIEIYRTLYAYPFLFFSFFVRFFSLAFGVFSRQDEARISELLGTGTYTVAVVVLIILIALVWGGSRRFKYRFKEISYFFLISTLCMLLVIGSYTIYDYIFK
jgi:hypothetical protein